MQKLISIVFLCGILCIMACGCEKDDGESIKSIEGYLVGFDPCTINHHYRVGYVIISTDLNDTLVTYNLSDNEFRMPASILNNLSDTLYKIPELYFQNYGSCPYFPDTLRYKYKVNISYLTAADDEKVYNLCTTDIFFLHYEQVVVKTATK